jgi:GNAT superfamily N-acetyltransferase
VLQSLQVMAEDGGIGNMLNVRPLEERDLPEGQRIVRRAFGTFLGAADLDNFWTDFDYVYGRFGCEHTAAFAADHDGTLAGVNFATNWGSVGFFGPLSVRPDLWDKGIAQPLVAAVSEQFVHWGTRHAGLCTFAQSTKHLWLYQKFGFYPRFLTAIMAAPAAASGPLRQDARYTALAPGERQAAEATLCCCGTVRAISAASRSAIGDRRARPAPIVSSSNSARCAPVWVSPIGSARCSMPPARSPAQWGWRGSWLGSIPDASKPIAR